MNQLILKAKDNNRILPLVNEALKDKTLLLLLSINRLQNELKEYEKKFIMHSEEFYNKYQTGQMGDSPEIIDWAGKFEILFDLKDEYQTLKEIEICI